MSNRRSRSHRRAALVASSTALASLLLLPNTSNADPEPTIDEVRREVERLHHDAERAAELSNEYGDKAESIGRRLNNLQADIDRQRDDVAELRQRIGQFAMAEYKAAGTDSTMQLILADDPEKFLAQMSSARAVRGQQADLLTKLTVEDKELADRELLQMAERARLVDARKQAKERIQVAKDKAAKAEALLAELTDEQDDWLDSGADGDPPLPPASGRGGTALAFAQEQLGEPYVLSASGPDAWDCSGLTMMAWAEAGVSLPHSAREQYYQSAKVSRSDLQPGDLVLFYSDLHHVGLYAGNGLILHAPNSSRPVEYADISSMPYAGAARPG